MVGSSIPLMSFAFLVWNAGEKGLFCTVIGFLSIFSFIGCMILWCGVFSFSDFAGYSFIVGLFFLLLLLAIVFFGEHYELKRKYQEVKDNKK